MDEQTQKNIEILTGEFGKSAVHVGNIVRLLDEGNTVPFIARYRKEMHGTTDDQTIREISERLQYLRGLDKRREEILGALENQDKLTEELRSAVAAAETLAALEDIYRPFKQKRRTRATIAKGKGLEPLARALYEQQRNTKTPEELALDYVNQGADVNSVAEALDGARDIVAEWISDDANIRGALRVLQKNHARLISRAAKEEDSVYRTYYDYSEPVGRVPSHRVLAINRGEKEGYLKVSAETEEEPALQLVRRACVRPGSFSMAFVREAAEDAYRRLLAPSMERELRSTLTEAANEQAIAAFGANLRPLLMQPPLKNRVTMGFDPAYRTGCKIAVVDVTGKVLETGVVYPTPPHSKTAEAKAALLRMIKKHGVTAIAIGNGTASKESEIFVAEMLKDCPGVRYMVVSEAGASVYSASKLAAKEFPDYDVSLRSAVSIARRLQDPLAELVKIDPKSIGVGQYQHDMPAARLDETLSGVVEDCVNAVGADLNTASASLLEHVAGLSATAAANIVRRREQEGPFTDRGQLLKVPKIGPKTFEQCAGFLRISDGENVLDATGVHPESYGVAKKLLAACGLALSDVKNGRVAELRKRAEELGGDALSQMTGAGIPTLWDIVSELEKPGRDPREELPPPMLRTDVMTMEDLRPGMVLQGTVRNVVDFGAYVDIGVHRDGLVHISHMADRFVRRAGELVTVGDVINVAVLEVDMQRGRISLTMKKSEMSL